MKILMGMVSLLALLFVTTPVRADEENPTNQQPVCQEGQTENCVLLE